MKEKNRKFFKRIFIKETKEMEVLLSNINKTVLRIIEKEKEWDLKLAEVHHRSQKLDNLFDNLDISIDQHMNKYSKSWAVVSIQGQKSDFIQFFDLGQSDIRQIQDFLRSFDKRSNIKIDSFPNASGLFKIKRGRGRGGRNIQW